MRINTETIELKSITGFPEKTQDPLYLLQLQRDQLISRVNNMIAAIERTDLCGND